MKKNYIILLLFVAASFQLKAQTTYFTQNFDSTQVYTDYVTSTPSLNHNLFDYSKIVSTGGVGVAAISTASNKLNLTRSSSAVTGDAVSITRVSNIFPITAKVLQLSFDYVANTVSGPTTIQSGGYLNIGTPTATDGNSAVVLPIAQATLKLRFDTDNPNNQFRVVNFKSNGTANGATGGASYYYPTGTGIHIDVVFNYTSNGVTYSAPTSPVTTGTLASGTVDLYVNGILQTGITGQPIATPGLIPTGIRINLASTVQDFSLDNMVIKDATVLSVLPVNLISFNGKAESNGVTLNWATASEQNSDRFEVQRLDTSTKTFNTIETIPAAGNSNDKRTYQALDKQPLTGSNIYQLKQVDKDGTFKIMDKKVSIENPFAAATFEVAKSTNSTYQYKIYANSDETVELSIISLDGRVLSKKSLQVSLGFNSGELATSSLNAGLYLVHLKDSNNRIFVKKVLVSAD